jgi:5-hydroxyisourate hydrolase-like protein (transthyretin family)
MEVGMRVSGADQKRGTGPRRLKAFVLCALAILAVALVAPRGAEADYSVLECAPGEQDGFADVGLYAAGGYSILVSNHCGGIGFRLDAKGVSARDSWVAWQVNAPGGTRFKSAQATVHYGTDGGYGPMSTSDGSPGFGGLSGGAGPNQWATPVQTNANYFAIIEQCFANPCNSNWAYAWSTRFYGVVQDFHAPGLSAGGELLGGGVVSGVQPLQVTATDAGGGARSISIYVNGVGSQGLDFCPPRAAGYYDRVKPCPDSSGARLFSLDTEKDAGWVNGPNDLVICSTDVAGNSSAPCLRRTVYVDNSCPASGAQQATNLESGADIGGRLRSHSSVRSTDSPVIRGRLTTTSGNPVGGATVCVYETVALEDASRQLLTTATTQANGRFATRLEPGASRKLDLVYRYNTKILGDSVRLDSTVVPTLKLGEKSVANGQRVHFKGGLPGPNAAGRAVALQARAGKKWRTFKLLKTDNDGAFKGLYRFTQTSGRARYLFRALVKRQGGYPYEPGASRKRKLLVHG